MSNFSTSFIVYKKIQWQIILLKISLQIFCIFIFNNNSTKEIQTNIKFFHWQVSKPEISYSSVPEFHCFLNTCWINYPYFTRFSHAMCSIAAYTLMHCGLCDLFQHALYNFKLMLLTFWSSALRSIVNKVNTSNQQCAGHISFFVAKSTDPIQEL